ncbi:hypothetical protein GCK72_004008 [Caenorhabditis remanei]|uniref:Uncharacterized protein n=1 Tax=Caenorhabditis remanei TaxID=31234 RepID=A0A6A5HCE8_CAERE|nr:hypothetical protein GCK72_004008 [Caenorhabditis remanei]KAF1764062.1 hypothetical protein GCK72_004008 [Caenorhabditis remanei]
MPSVRKQSSFHRERVQNEAASIRIRSHSAKCKNRIHHIDIEPQVNYFIAVFQNLDDRREDTVEHIRFDNNQRIYEVFEPYLRCRGLTTNDVEFFLEKSSTPIPEGSGAHFLAGQKIYVRGMFDTK